MEFFVSLVGGILSFFSPCFFPLVPAYISLVAGVSLKRGYDRKKAFVFSLIFVLGFSLAFSLMGASASFFGKIIKAYKNEFLFVAGIVFVFLGLSLMGIIKIPFLLRERRFNISKIDIPFLFPFVFGFIFAVGWTPCIGPILAGILLIATSHSNAGYGALLLFVYSLGIGIPIILASLFMAQFLEFSAKFKRFLRAVEISSGLLLVAFGLVFISNKIHLISNLGFDLNKIEQKIANYMKIKDEEFLSSLENAKISSSEIYRRIFSGKFEPVNKIMPSESQFVIVNFWATYCPPCKKEIPTLMKYLSEIQIIGIADDTKENVLDFLEKEDINYPIYLLDDILKDKIYVPYGLPESLFFYNGKFVGRYVGLLTEEEIKNFLNLDFSFLER